MTRRRGIFIVGLIFLALFGPSQAFAGSLELQLTLPQNTGQFIPLTFGSIAGVATDNVGNVYVSDTANNLIKKFDANGNLQASWPVESPGAITTAVLAGTTQCYVYAVCYGSEVKKFDLNGNVLLTFPLTYYLNQSSVAVDGPGNIYVVDRNLGYVLKFDNLGNFLLKWSLPAGSEAYGVAVEWSGLPILKWKVYVADYGNKCIEIYDNDGNPLGQWTGPGRGGATGFHAPWGVAMNSTTGHVYVFDGGAILQFTAIGNYLRQIGSNGSGKGQINLISTTNGLAVDSAGNVYVVGANNGVHILKFDATGGYVAQWGGLAPSWQINGHVPAGVAIDGAGHIYVNVGNGIRRFDADGRFFGQWTVSGINQPCLDVDAAGNVLVPVFFSSASIETFDSCGWGFLLGQWDVGNGTLVGVALHRLPNIEIYVADYTNCCIKKFDANGNLLTQWGSRGAGNGQFQYLYALATDGGGNVYVADNNRIQKFDSLGKFLATWGTYGTGNGQFSQATGVAVDAAGHVFVADNGNKRIQMFTSNGRFLAAWSTYAPGVAFKNPWKVAVDGQGRLYVTEWDSSTTTSILVFTVPKVASNTPVLELLLQ